MLYDYPQKPDFLQGQLLVATPLLKGSCFEKSVIYVCVHNEAGAVGLLINHPLMDLNCSDILNQLGMKTPELICDMPVYFGGPVDTSKGFILHTNDYFSDSTQSLNDNFSLTSTVGIVKDITSGRGPIKSIVALGYAGWSAGQLEEEIKTNSWINVPASEEIIFGTDNRQKWQKSAHTLGIDLLQYSEAIGHA